MNYHLLQQKYTVNTYPDRLITLVRGQGVYLFDQAGTRYLDMMSNYGVNIFGYSHPKIDRALIGQIKRLTTLHGVFNNDIRAEASERLVKKCGGDYSKVYWSNSGAEAIEAALKFAVLSSGKKKFVVCKRGYHGKTLGALSATAGDKYKAPFEPLLWKFAQVEFGDTEVLEKAIDKQTAAFLIEPIQGEGGVVVPAVGYLGEVRKICHKRKILLIIDEIQTGCGRTGSFLASEGVGADILCLGKGLAGGVPIGATVVSAKVAGAIPKHVHTSTFGGNPLACSGVIATLSLLDNKILKQVSGLGDYFVAKLRQIKSKLIVDVRGRGLLVGVEVKDSRNQLLKLMQDEKILVIPAGEDVVRFLPPFLITKKNIDLVVNKFQKCVDFCSSNPKN